MFQKRFGRRRKLRILMMIRRGNSASDGGKRNRPDDLLEVARENCGEFLRRNYLKLGIRAIGWLFVGPPAAEVRHVTKAASLHMFVSDFHNQLGPQGFPRQVFALAPAALAARHAMAGFTACGFRAGPTLPRVINERILSIGIEEFCQLTPFLRSETCANTNVLQRTGIIKEAKQQRANQGAIAFFIPAKSRHDTVAVALVFYFQHGAFVRLVDSRRELGHDTVQAGTFEATKPIRRDFTVGGCRCEMDRWWR